MPLTIATSDEVQELSRKIDLLLEWTVNSVPTKSENVIYTNAELCRKLGVSSKTLQGYRDNGLIDFDQVGRKIYYSQQDLDDFLGRYKVKAYRKTGGTYAR